jgi:NADP-dependent 3-hydroxy acid dehydrogenase YdfG
VRKPETVADLQEQYGDAFRVELFDVTDAAAVRSTVDRAFGDLGRIASWSATPGTGSSARPKSSPTSRSSELTSSTDAH